MQEQQPYSVPRVGLLHAFERSQPGDQAHFMDALSRVPRGRDGMTTVTVFKEGRQRPAEYHWARFEAFEFTKASPDAIGARGQGKFMFLSVSKNFTMFYDTLRDDGVYRVGATQAQHVGCPILPPSDAEPWEGARGAQELMDRCGLTPLKKVGSRIIILEPTDELLRQVAN